MSNKAQLILTYGISDLQVIVVNTKGETFRAIPEKNKVREFHEWLLKRLDTTELIALPQEITDRRFEQHFYSWDDKGVFLSQNNSATEAKFKLNKQNLQLVLPKVEPAINSFLEQLKKPESEENLNQTAMAAALQKKITINYFDSVLVLSTNREKDLQEPVATFTFIQQWFVGLGAAASSIYQEIYLKGTERLESAKATNSNALPVQAVDPIIAKRIEQAIIQFYNPTSKNKLLVATMGGIPLIKSFIAEVAVLLAGEKRTLNLFRSEEGVAGLLPQNPVDFIHARRQCLKLVQRGAFLEAWYSAALFHKDPTQKHWLKPLEQAASLINGNPLKEEASLPALQEILRLAKTANCLLIGVRIESALHSERWLEAINNTITFLEVAVSDALQQWEQVQSFNPRTKIISFKPGFNYQRLLNSEKGRALEKEDGKLRADTIGRNAKTWLQEMNRHKLTEFNRRLFSEWDDLRGTTSPTKFRNFGTHGILSQDEINEAITAFSKRELWSNLQNDSAQPGQAFLGRKHACAVLRNLIDEELEPLQLYRNLIDELSAALRNPYHKQA